MFIMLLSISYLVCNKNIITLQWQYVGTDTSFPFNYTEPEDVANYFCLTGKNISLTVIQIIIKIILDSVIVSLEYLNYTIFFQRYIITGVFNNISVQHVISDIQSQVRMSNWYVLALKTRIYFLQISSLISLLTILFSNRNVKLVF